MNMLIIVFIIFVVLWIVYILYKNRKKKREVAISKEDWTTSVNGVDGYRKGMIIDTGIMKDGSRIRCEVVKVNYRYNEITLREIK